MIETPGLREAALDWLVRTNDPEFDGWDEFTAWLEADPAHADAYHGLADSEAEMLPLVSEVAVEAPAEPDRRLGQRRLALAASVAHEINNPLAFVMGNLEYLRERLPCATLVSIAHRPAVAERTRPRREAGAGSASICAA